jgi:DNA-binding CsgD family transcriptional regulator
MSSRSEPGAPREGALLDLIGDVCGLLDIDDMRHGVLAALHRALPSDYVSLNDVGPAAEDVVTIMEPDAPELLRRWQELAHQNPLLQHHLRTLDGRAYRFSDVISQRDLHALDLYREVYAPMGVEHQMAFTLPASPNRVLAIALSRRARDYSDGERELANEARPFLIQSYLNALAYSSLRDIRAGPDAPPMLEALVATGLTGREAQVVRLVALGRSNQHIAAELGISDRTVGKHLEHSFRKLGVGDRSSAAGRVWEIARPGGSGAVVGEHDAGVLAARPDVSIR